jgi:single-stranded-DNA-specific exonuclease
VDARLEIPPCPTADVAALRRALGVSAATAQVLVRRGLADPAAARAWLDAGEAHDPSAFAGMEDAVALVLRHVRQGTRITVHGDYDVDGVSATAILVGVLRELGAAVDWHLPSRAEDGYGLSAATVERLAARDTRLLVTADCGITAVEEVARARSLGLDVVVTDHHAPRADGALPEAPVVHPALGGYPCAELCAAGVAHKVTAALLAAAGRDPARADADLDLVALATVADCVPLRGENRRLVRAGLRALARTRRPGLRALLRVAQADPGALDARTIGFRLAPRLNAAGRLQRADAGLELLLTEDPDRAQAVAEELDRLNAERRHVETRIRFEAEAQVAELGDQPAYVLWGEDWHPGVVGIVAARIAERHHRPAVLVALDGEQGTGSARSIPAFDLLGGLDACADRLLRHGGHRAAAGCTVARSELEAFRAELAAHAAAVLAPEDLVPVQKIDAVVGGDELGLELAEELERLAPFGIANPGVTLLVPAARLRDPRPMGEGRHVRFTVESAGSLARGVAFGRGSLPEGPDGVLDAAFALERNEWQGAVEPRLVLRCARPPDPAPIAVLDPAHAAGHLATALAALAEPPPPAPAPAAAGAPPLPASATGWGSGEPARTGEVRDRRGCGVAGMLGALVASGEPVVVVCADAALRAKHLAGRLGGFGLCSYDALAGAPALADGAAHLVALDPPACAAHAALLAPAGGRTVHLAWGPAETAFALRVVERDHDVRPALAAVYRDLRDGGRPLAEVLTGSADAPRPTALAARLLRILHELGLIEVDAAAGTASCPPAARTQLDRSATFRASAARLAEGRRRLAPAAAAPMGAAPPAPAAPAPPAPAEPLPTLAAAGA